MNYYEMLVDFFKYLSTIMGIDVDSNFLKFAVVLLIVAMWLVYNFWPDSDEQSEIQEDLDFLRNNSSDFLFETLRHSKLNEKEKENIFMFMKACIDMCKNEEDIEELERFFTKVVKTL